MTGLLSVRVATPPQQLLACVRVAPTTHHISICYLRMWDDLFRRFLFLYVLRMGDAQRELDTAIGA